MALSEQIEKDFVAAMKNKDAEKVSTLRLAKAALSNYRIEKKRDDLKDDEVVAILQKQAKQHSESMESYKKAGREDLAAREEKELAVIMGYLPRQLSEGEIKVVVEGIAASLGASGKSAIGQVMKEAMVKLKGKADGKLVNRIVGTVLAGKDS